MNNDNGNLYFSSIINKYGDATNVKKDVKTLNDILDRQGSTLLLDIIAEKVGDICANFKLSDAERMILVNKLTIEFKESLLERV